MKMIASMLCLLFAVSAMGQKIPGDGKVSLNARVVIAPMGGFETYFAAAVHNKKTPITLTLDKESAQYFVVSTDQDWQGYVSNSQSTSSAHVSGPYGNARGQSSSNSHSTRGVEGSIMLIDAKTLDVMWAYEVHKRNARHGQQSVAEACAKHLKSWLETGKE